MAYSATILADSVTPRGRRIVSAEITIPRMVLCDLNTHRIISKNGPSSRAVPLARTIAAVESDPYIPEVFYRNTPGMEGKEPLTGAEHDAARDNWLRGLDAALQCARWYQEHNAHKQHGNRLLEPYSWQKTILTATEWSNFYALRCHPAADIGLRRAIEMLRAAHVASTPTLVPFGGWHRILVPDIEQLNATFGVDEINLISVGRAARVSYLTHHGVRDPAADLAAAGQRRAEGHMSPFEHVAQAVDTDDMIGNLKGWKQLRKFIPGEHDFSLLDPAKAARS